MAFLTAKKMMTIAVIDIGIYLRYRFLFLKNSFAFIITSQDFLSWGIIVQIYINYNAKIRHIFSEIFYFYIEMGNDLYYN